MMADLSRVVLDTNVLVAAAYNATSASRRIVEACLNGERTVVVSPALRREYDSILACAVRGPSYLESQSGDEHQRCWRRRTLPSGDWGRHDEQGRETASDDRPAFPRQTPAA
jgi:hypothetical protein